MYRIGVDLGGTNIAGGLVDEKYRILKRLSVPTNKERSAEAILDDVCSLCLELCRAEGIDISSVNSIGLASPGVANRLCGTVEYCSSLPFRNFDVCRYISGKTGVSSVFVENDANAAALGEALAGAARGTKNSVMITLGTGVGGGVIINGRIYSGFNFAAGELGHTVIEYDGRPCSCGRRGCWEKYSSATALISMTAEAVAEYSQNGAETVMSKVDKIDGRTAFDAMRKGDTAGKEVVDKYVKYLACGLTNMINIFQPEMLSIGGGISNEGELLLSMLEPQVHAKRYGAGFVKGTKICIARLGNDAGIIGAANLWL